MPHHALETPASSSVDANGLMTAYRRAGTGDPLLYLGDQGYPGVWLPLFGRLAESFDVVVPDHPGFAGTELPDDLLDFADLSVHYATFLDGLGIGPVHMVGHGFGGWVAAEFAAAYPERIRSLTLVAPTGLRPDDGEAMFDPYRVDRDGWLDRALGPGRQRWLARIEESADWAERTLSDYRERIGVARVAWNPRYSLRLERRLRRVTAPAQILVPESDLLVAPSIARRYAELLGAPRTTVPGDGYRTEHLVVLQEPDAVAAEITALASGERSSR